MTTETEDKIQRLRNLIRMMDEEGEIYGLTREDRNKKNKWISEIVILKQKNDN